MQRRGARASRKERKVLPAALIGLCLLFGFSQLGERHTGSKRVGICSLRRLVLFISMSAGQARRVGCSDAETRDLRVDVACLGTLRIGWSELLSGPLYHGTSAMRSEA
jgi:hypothetical protein